MSKWLHVKADLLAIVAACTSLPSPLPARTSGNHTDSALCLLKKRKKAKRPNGEYSVIPGSDIIDIGVSKRGLPTGVFERGNV